MSDRIEKTIELKAPVERVWRALTDHVEFGQWFGVRLDEPFVAGQPTNGQITTPGFDHIKWTSVTKTMEPPTRFAFTWHPYAIDSEVDYSAETPTTVEFVLEPIGGGTRLTVTESGFDALPPERRDVAFRMNDGGWAAQLRNIKAHVAD